MEQITKTEFKTQALEVLRAIEKTGKSRIITDHGKPKFEIRKLQQKTVEPLEVLKGTVVKYDDITTPVVSGEWVLTW